ncbi:MAG TPA: response regulator [Stellaceae bacterium]|jgi:DNA-binding response OmpR family regulator|nr:response regulator [Stellaceae bacterium]
MPRILLVEDDAEVRILVEHVLLDADYEVDAVETFGCGSELLGLRDYNLVIADGRLQDGTGMMLADEARQRGVAALILTGYAFVLQAAGVDLGQYDVLLKPISPEELLYSVEKTLATRSQS